MNGAVRILAGRRVVPRPAVAASEELRTMSPRTPRVHVIEASFEHGDVFLRNTRRGCRLLVTEGQAKYVGIAGEIPGAGSVASGSDFHLWKRSEAGCQSLCYRRTGGGHQFRLRPGRIHGGFFQQF